MNRKTAAALAGVLVVLVIALGARGCTMAGRADASSCVQAQLDLMFQGETQEAQELLGASAKELEQIYENGVQAFITTYLMDGAEDLSAAAEAFGPPVKAVFQSVRYSVDTESEKDGRNRKVKVTYQPSDVFTQFAPRLKETAKQIEAAARLGAYTGTEEEISQAMLSEYLTKAVSLLEDSYLNLHYGGKQEFVFTVNYEKPGEPALENEEITEFMEKILELDKL